jgi:TetR/AcrR family transcriptional repressor of nem operon
VARPRTFDEDEVLEGAVEIFREKGFDGTSVPEITSRLGICRQSLYSAFGDKRTLYLRALERWGEREIDAKLDLLAADGSPLENVRTVVRGVAGLATQCPSEGCLTAIGIVETRDDPDARAVLHDQVKRLEDGFRGALARARDLGEIRPDARPGRLARALVTTMYGIGLLARLEGSGPRIGDAVSVLLDVIDAAVG